MDLRKLKTIVELFERSAIEEMEIAEGEEKIRLVKHSKQKATDQAVQVAQTSSVPTEDGKEFAADATTEVGFVFKSPMVGTYYASPAPDKPAYVKVGDIVNEGDVVCIIEAMKLMNEIRAPVAGKILALRAKNSEPVAFGDELMTIG